MTTAMLYGGPQHGVIREAVGIRLHFPEMTPNAWVMHTYEWDRSADGSVIGRYVGAIPWDPPRHDDDDDFDPSSDEVCPTCGCDPRFHYDG